MFPERSRWLLYTPYSTRGRSHDCYCHTRLLFTLFLETCYFKAHVTGQVFTLMCSFLLPSMQKLPHQQSNSLKNTNKKTPIVYFQTAIIIKRIIFISFFPLPGLSDTVRATDNRVTRLNPALLCLQYDRPSALCRDRRQVRLSHCKTSCKKFQNKSVNISFYLKKISFSVFLFIWLLIHLTHYNDCGKWKLWMY